MAPKPRVTDDDEVINVTLPLGDYEVMRDMIERQKSLNWLGKYVRTVLFVFAGGVLTLVMFYDTIVGIFKKVLGLS
jgi:hypothetical protein